MLESHATCCCMSLLFHGCHGVGGNRPALAVVFGCNYLNPVEGVSIEFFFKIERFERQQTIGEK